MSFTDTQTASLKAPLSRQNVRSRKQGGQDLSYVEGWHAIAEANRIFGFDAWDRETLDVRQLGEPRIVNGKARIAYMARVRITVRAGDTRVIREGCGFGSGIDGDVGQAHEKALKEAETDAMKRGLMTFGNPFGLALYDKAQAGVTDDPPEGDDPVEDPAEVARRHIADCERAIDASDDAVALREWWNGDDRKRGFRENQLDEAEGRALGERVRRRVEALTGSTRAAA